MYKLETNEQESKIEQLPKKVWIKQLYHIKACSSSIKVWF